MKKSYSLLAAFTLGYVIYCLTHSPSSSSGISNNNSLFPILWNVKNPVPPPPPNDFFRFITKCSAPVPNHEVIPTLLARVYNDISPYSQFPPPHIVPYLRTNVVHGWGSTNSVFKTLIELVKPRVIIEVGSFLGASTLHMAKLTRDLGLKDTLIVCMDDFRGWPGFRDSNNGIFKNMSDVNGDVVLMQQFMQNVVDAGEEARILPVPFATGAGLDALCQWGVQGDLIEIDAGHSFHSAWEDINRAWKVLKPGGVLFGHDYPYNVDDYGVKRAVDLFAKVNGLTVKPDREHWILFQPSFPLLHR